mgnify:CR=1 FL=1
MARGGNAEVIRARAATRSIPLDPGFPWEVGRASGQPVMRCFQCGRCTNGCPLTWAMDHPPHRLLRMVQLGAEGEVLVSRTIWLCSACHGCATRCPNDIHLPAVMDALKQMALARRVRVGDRQVALFHRLFLATVARLGRMYELGLIGLHKLASGNLFGDLKVGLLMFTRGKLSPLPQLIKGRGDLRAVWRRAAALRREGGRQ